MMDRKRKLIYLIFIIFLIYLALKHYILPGINSFLLGYFTTVSKYKSCISLSSEEMDFIDNFAISISGVEYDKRVAVCLEKEKTGYCLLSNLGRFSNINIIYFDKLCEIQPKFNYTEDTKFIIIPYSSYELYKEKNLTIYDLISRGYVVMDKDLKEKVLEFMKNQ